MPNTASYTNDTRPVKTRGNYSNNQPLLVASTKKLQPGIKPLFTNPNKPNDILPRPSGRNDGSKTTDPVDPYINYKQQVNLTIFVYLCVCSFAGLFVCSFASLFVCLFICCLFVFCLFVCSFVYLFFCSIFPMISVLEIVNLFLLFVSLLSKYLKYPSLFWSQSSMHCARSLRDNSLLSSHRSRLLPIKEFRLFRY